MQALGLIETRGLLPAIEAADVMLKTAQVELVGRTFVGGGLVTITVTGDVGAVKAAVEAGVTAVEKIGHNSLVSQHIIPRPHQEIESMVVVRETTNITDPLPNQNTAVEPVTIESTNSAQLTQKQLHKEGVDAFVQELGLEKIVNVLKTLSVVKLRNLVREYKGLGIAGRAISKADKNSLIQKLKDHYERGIEPINNR